MRKVNVTVLVPDATVRSMADEIADGSVRSTLEAAKAVYAEIDSDGIVEVAEYDEDCDNAVAKAIQVAEGTTGRDLVVVLTDFQSNDRARAEQLLTGKIGDDMIVFVPVSNQGYDETWADRLDNGLPTSNRIDVVTVDGLGNRDTAFAKVGPWLNA